MPLFLRVCAFFLIAWLNFLPRAAADLRCGSYIVSPGETTYDVLMKCGQPTWVDQNDMETIEKTQIDTWQKTTLKREIWLYNNGPTTLMRELTFENDRLIDIKVLGYGYVQNDIGRYANDEKKLYMNMSKAEVVVQWGDPDHKTDKTVEQFRRINQDKVIAYNVTLSEWTYNFGSRRFTKILSFENGRLVKIATGNYGYDR